MEDLLEDPKARFAALIVDVGEDDMIQCTDYADAFGDRLEERGIPRERFHFQKVALEVPDRKDLFGTLRRMREFLKLEFPRYYWNPNYEPWLPSNIQLPETGDHLPRAVAKAIYAKAYYDDDRVMEQALSDFAAHVEEAEIPSLVLVCCSLAGGTGSGMVVDLARHLSSVEAGAAHPCDRGWSASEQRRRRGRSKPVPDAERDRLHAGRRQECRRLRGVGRSLPQPVHGRVHGSEP